MKILEADMTIGADSIASELNMAQKNIWRHLYKGGYKKKRHVWVTRELTQKT